MSPGSSCLSSLAAVAFAVATSGASAQEAPPAPESPPCCRGAAPLDPNEPRPTDRKSLLLREIGQRILESNAPFLGEGGLATLDRQIEQFTAGGTVPSGSSMHFVKRGGERLMVGRIDDAIADFGIALEEARTRNDVVSTNVLLGRLGLAWMRLGERRNCVANHNQDSCLLPLKDGAIHVDRVGSENAVKCFTEVLEASPDDVATIWLLNLAHMTLGSWPDGVPERWRVPPSAFVSEREMPRMYDVAPKLGLNRFTRAGGAILDDFDGDGRIDVLTSSMDQFQPLRMFRQQKDRTFKDVTVEVGLIGQLGGLQIFHFDADNDGRLDILVQRGGWMGRAGEIPNSLLIQQQDGTFLDRTKEAGIEISAPSQAACFADVDNDGDLDLFLGYEGSRQQGIYPSRLFRNRGDGTFEELSEKVGIVNCGFVKGCAFGDYDEDGLPDLYVTTMRDENHLYHNDGNWHFTDVARKLGVNGPRDSFSCFFFDYDNDGRLDLYASCYDQGDRVTAQAAYFKDGKVLCDVNHLYRNDGRGGFVDVTRQVKLDRVAFPMGSNFGDVDNDGYPDLYLATGAPDFGALFPNVMYHNDGGRRFEDVTTATGTGMLQKGNGVAFADLDGDGDQDLFNQTGGNYKDDAFADVLFENPGHGNHWLTVRLKGVRSNRFGIGARIRTTIEEGSEPAATRSVFTFVGMNSSFGGNSLQAEMGMGQATRIAELEVFWPTTGVKQIFREVPLDRVVEVKEDDPALRVVAPPAR